MFMALARWPNYKFWSYQGLNIFIWHPNKYYLSSNECGSSIWWLVYDLEKPNFIKFWVRVIAIKHTNGCLYGSMWHAAATIWSTAIQNPTTVVWFRYHSWSWALTAGQNMYFDGGGMHMKIVGHKKDTIFWGNFQTFLGMCIYDCACLVCTLYHMHTHSITWTFKYTSQAMGM